jgi:hypothetical protein
MIHRLSRIIAHDEWVGPQRLAAVRTGVVQARHSREQAVMIVDDEHLGVLLHQSLSEYAVLLGSRLSGMSVANGRMDGKRVCQFGLPNGVKDVMRRSPSAHDPFLAKLFRAHPEENYLFYLGASLDETLKRHETKSHPRISKEKMNEVYPYASPTGHEKEIIIPEGSSLEQTIEHITKIVGISHGLRNEVETRR